MESILKTEKPQAARWYREPWMWLIVGGPAIIVVASIFMAYLAFDGADQVVAPDYYKRGLAINQDIRRDLTARERGMAADLQINAETAAVTLRLSGQGELPPTLAMTLSRAAGKGSDEITLKMNLVQAGAGIYHGKLNLPAGVDGNAAVLWQVNLDGGDWRLASGWYGPVHAGITMKPAA